MEIFQVEDVKSENTGVGLRLIVNMVTKPDARVKKNIFSAVTATAHNPSAVTATTRYDFGRC